MGPEEEVSIQNLSPTDSKHPELFTAEPVPSVPAEGLAPRLNRKAAWAQKGAACWGEGYLSLVDFQ